VTTNYVLDLNAGLTQVLADGTNTYLYGNGRIGELQPGGFAYHLGDALGSVRQLADASGGVTLARSFEPYGNTLTSTSAGSSNSVFQYTGEARDSTGLQFNRARYYASVTGTFLTADPSRQERNLFQYAGSNPVNRTDPSGLFSREIVAKSFGYSTFEDALTAYASDSGGILTGKKWGWVATLLAAEDGDVLRVGSPVISDLHPYVHYKSAERIWLRDCDEIMIGSRPLLDYTNYVVNTPNPRELPIIWRDTSASYYVLVKNRAPGYLRYVDGSVTTDYPDFHSVDVSLWTGLIGGGPLNIEFSGVVDRFGNKYLVGGASFGIPGGGLTYSEGYVCSPYANCLSGQIDKASTRDDSNLVNTITGACISAGLVVDWGALLTRCASDTGAITFSTGVALSFGVSGTAGLYIGRDDSLGWNWAIRDRLDGVTLEDIH